MTLEDLFAATLRPKLLEAGFTGRGRTLLRLTEGSEQGISLAKGQRSMQGRFAIELMAQPRLTGPGLPGTPTEPGAHWLRRRLAPEGQSDAWWPNDAMSADDVRTVTRLVLVEAPLWFTPLNTLEDFAALWRDGASLDGAWDRYGALPARWAYLQAVAHGHLGRDSDARRIADRALSVTGPRAVSLRAWIKSFSAGL